MSVLMRLKQARTPDQVAEALEPLALSLASLADRAQISAEAVSRASQDQAASWSAQQAAAAQAVRAAADQVQSCAGTLKQASASLRAAADQVQKERARLRRNVWVASCLSAILASALSIASWRWLAPAPPPPILDARAVAEHLKPALQEALRGRR